METRDERDDVLDLLYEEGGAESALDDAGRGELARLRELRGVLREVAAKTDADPAPASMAILMAAARQAKPERKGLLARLAGWFQVMAAHPAMAAAATVVVVGGVAGALYVRGSGKVASPTVSEGAPAASAPAPVPPQGEDDLPAQAGAAGSAGGAGAGSAAGSGSGSGSGVAFAAAEKQDVVALEPVAANGRGPTGDKDERKGGGADAIAANPTGASAEPKREIAHAPAAPRPAAHGSGTGGGGRDTGGERVGVIGGALAGEALDQEDGQVGADGAADDAKSPDRTAPKVVTTAGATPAGQGGKAPAPAKPTSTTRAPTPAPAAPPPPPPPPPPANAPAEETLQIAAPETPTAAPPASTDAAPKKTKSPPPTAQQLTAQAKLAAKKRDCAAVGSLGARVHALDDGYYRSSFVTDPDIRGNCGGAPAAAAPAADVDAAKKK